jgi:membrane protease YdiL (CAAX protease family)
MAEAPGGPVQWLVTIGACVSTGYFEEGFFRLYLLTRFRETGISAARGICISTLLFALCHVYEGPGGVLNAALAGIVLSLVFTREGSLHGLAWAHGAYNILVYATIRLFP